ncbi:MAG: DUF1549 domain-containing protein [Bryobacteraceae bacterium]
MTLASAAMLPKMVAAPPELPPSASRHVDFAQEVHPLLLSRCAGCHTGDKPQAGLRLNTREEMLKGGTSGPAIVPGTSKDSLLIHRVAGVKPPVMPIVGDPLTPEEIGILRAWIDQGAKTSAEAETTSWQAPLAPRRPELPPEAEQFSNRIDYFLDTYFRKHKIEAGDPVSDAAFARRAYFDLWGLPAAPAELAAFVEDKQPGKRERLVDTLLANRRYFTGHWISFWNDLLHNDEGVTYIGDRKSITPWLQAALDGNMPYDQMVRSLINPVKEDDPEGFIMGVNWRGAINASQTPVMQAAQNSSQVFLGVNLKCNSCHDSFISKWKLKDAYGMASFFSSEPLELVRCDAKTGEMSSPKFLYPELGSVSPDAPLAEKKAIAAELFTKRENGRLARTFVNRIWERLLGRGLVEPLDDMDAEPWNPDLLDWLADEFAVKGYDINWLLKQVMTSRAYQLPSVPSTETEEKPYVFRGPQSRRLSAEQFVDSISAITGEWRVLRSKKPEPGVYSREWHFKASPLTRALGRPNRDLAVTERNNEPTTLQMLELVNGDTLAQLLRRGAKQMLGELPPAPESVFDSGAVGSNVVRADADITGASKLWLMMEDEDSYDPSRVTAGWADAVLQGPGGSVKLSELIPPEVLSDKASTGTLKFKDEAPKDALIAKLGSRLVVDLGGREFTRFRAAVGVDEASLHSDISPKIRFYVFTAEPDPHRLARVKGEPPVPFAKEKFTPDTLVTRLFLHALGRQPDADERKLAKEYLGQNGAGDSISSDGLEDLLWSIFLSPEFQYIS